MTTTLGSLAVLAGRTNGKTVAQPLDIGSLVASLALDQASFPLGSLAGITAALKAWTEQDDDAHDTCDWGSLVACRNPLHPGPCKGWKGTLNKVAPGTYKQVEEERVRKANERRVKIISDLKAQGKPIPKRLLAEIKPKPAPSGASGGPGTVPLGQVNQKADLAGGQAHVAGQNVSKAAGVVTKTAGPLPLGPKQKKPTVAGRGPAFVITQPKVTDQYKLDKAAKITPQEWDSLSDADKKTIRDELEAIKVRGFGPQQRKSDELLAKLPAPGAKASNTPGNASKVGNLTPGTPGTITTPSGKTYQKVAATPPAAPGKVTLGQATKAPAAPAPSAPAAPSKPAPAGSTAAQAGAVRGIADAVYGKQTMALTQLTSSIEKMKAGGKKIEDHPGFKALVNRFAQDALSRATADGMPGIGHGSNQLGITEFNHQIRDHIAEGRPGLPPVIQQMVDHRGKSGTPAAPASTTPVRVSPSTVQVGDVVDGNMVSGRHTVAQIKHSTSNLGNSATAYDFYDANGALVFTGRSNAKVTVHVPDGGGTGKPAVPSTPSNAPSTAKMNPAAAAVVAQLKKGSVVESLDGANKGSQVTVSHLSEKSVHFTNGQYENKRSMHRYKVVSADGDSTPPPGTPAPDGSPAAAPAPSGGPGKAPAGAIPAPVAATKTPTLPSPGPAPASSPSAPSGPAVFPPHVQQARAVAGRALGGRPTAKTHLEAYGKLTKADFDSLDGPSQRIIRDDLANAKAKFLDPKKQQAAQDLLDRFGSRHTTPAPGAPAAPTKLPDAHQQTLEKIASGAKVVNIGNGRANPGLADLEKQGLVAWDPSAKQFVLTDAGKARVAKGYSDPMNEAVKAANNGAVSTDDLLKRVGALSQTSIKNLNDADRKTILGRLAFIATHPKATPDQKARATAYGRIINSGSPAQQGLKLDHEPSLGELHREEEKAAAAKGQASAARRLAALQATDAKSGATRDDRIAALAALSKGEFDALPADEQRKILDALQEMHHEKSGYGKTHDAVSTLAGDSITKLTGHHPAVARVKQAEADFQAGKLNARGLHDEILHARVQAPLNMLRAEEQRIAEDNPRLPLWARASLIENKYTGVRGNPYDVIAQLSMAHSWDGAPRFGLTDMRKLFNSSDADLAGSHPIHVEAIKKYREHVINTGLAPGSPWSSATKNQLVDSFLRIDSTDKEVPADRIAAYEALPDALRAQVRKVLRDRLASQTNDHAKVGTWLALRELEARSPLTTAQRDAALAAAETYPRTGALDAYRKLPEMEYAALEPFVRNSIQAHLDELQEREERRMPGTRTWTPQDNALKVMPAALAAHLDGKRPSYTDRRLRNASDIANYGTKLINPGDRVAAYDAVPSGPSGLGPADRQKIVADLDGIRNNTTNPLALRFRALYSHDVNFHAGTLNLDQLKAVAAVNPAANLPDSSVVSMLDDLDKADFDKLDQVYRDTIDDRIKTLPSSQQQALTAKFHPAAAAANPTGVAPTSAQANVPPHVQTALDVIYGTNPKAHTMAAQLSAYGALRGSDFGQLNSQEQSQLLGDLSFIATTAKGPSAAKAKLLIDRFTPPGTPAGQTPTPVIAPPANAVPGQVRYATPLKGTLVQAKDKGTGGDGWVTAPGGKRLWGKYGAAGLMLMHQDPATGEKRYLMVQRGPGISDPGKWQFPGGAIDSKETFHQGGTREVIEELGFKADALKDAEVHGEHTSSVPGSTWKYVSVAAQVPQMLKPDLSTHHARMETSDAKWMTEAEIRALDTSGKLLAPLAGGKLEQNVLSLFPTASTKLGQVARPGPVTKRLGRLGLPSGGRQGPAQFNAWPHAHKPSKGKDLIPDKATFDAMRQTIKNERKTYDGKTADGRLAAIGAKQGFDDTPTVVDKKEIDRLLATGDYIEAWRGVSGAGGWSARSRGGSGGKTAADINEEMRTGPAYYGKGIFGNGYYLATQKRVAEQYSDHTPGSLVRILIPKSAITKKYDKVSKEAFASSPRASKAKGAGYGETSTFYDPGRYAAAKGIDGIEIEPHHISPSGGARHVAATGKPAFNWLNRSVLIVQKEPA
jgi:8-oxo-dGTP pyrophosphatase MutT (NUDIX family)